MNKSELDRYRSQGASALVDAYERLVERNAELEQSVEDEINNRDNHHEWADRLANCISEILQVEIGEHSSENNPWFNALEDWNMKTNRVALLAQERDALVAHVEWLKSITTTGLANKRGSALDVLNEIDSLLRESPKTSLAERDAEVAKRAYIRGFVDATLSAELGCDGASTEQELMQEALPHAEQYANQLRAEDKE